MLCACQAQQSASPSTQPASQELPESSANMVTKYVEDPYIAMLAKHIHMPIDKQEKLLAAQSDLSAQKNTLIAADQWQGAANTKNRQRHDQLVNQTYLDILGKHLYKKKADFDSSQYVDNTYVAALAKELKLPVDKQIELLQILSASKTKRAALIKANQWKGEANVENRIQAQKEQKRALLLLLGKNLSQKKSAFDKSYQGTKY